MRLHRAVPDARPRALRSSARRFTPLVALVLCLLGWTSGAEETIEKRMDFLFGEHEKHLAFFHELKDSVVRDDKRAVAGLVRYPLNVFVGGRRTVVRSPAELVKRYHEVFNDNVVGAVKAQEADALFANWRGVMLGHGQVWFAGICAAKNRDKPCADMAIKVIAVNTNAPGT